jgi:hypothetical protein
MWKNKKSVTSAHKVQMAGGGQARERAYATNDAAPDEAVLLGTATHDVFLNAEVFWRSIPDAVWDFHIGG